MLAIIGVITLSWQYIADYIRMGRHKDEQSNRVQTTIRKLSVGGASASPGAGRLQREAGGIDGRQ